MTRWLNNYVRPKMRMAVYAEWFLDQFDRGEDLWFMLESHDGMTVPGDPADLDAKTEEQVNPVMNQEYVTWKFSGHEWLSLGAIL